MSLGLLSFVPPLLEVAVQLLLLGVERRQPLFYLCQSHAGRCAGLLALVTALLLHARLALRLAQTGLQGLDLPLRLLGLGLSLVRAAHGFVVP